MLFAWFPHALGVDCVVATYIKCHPTYHHPIRDVYFFVCWGVVEQTLSVDCMIATSLYPTVDLEGLHLSEVEPTGWSDWHPVARWTNWKRAFTASRHLAHRPTRHLRKKATFTSASISVESLKKLVQSIPGHVAGLSLCSCWSVSIDSQKNKHYLDHSILCYNPKKVDYFK